MTHKAPRPTMKDFDPEALRGMACGKLYELKAEEERLSKKEKRKEFAEWMMQDNKEFSYPWLRALTWLYEFENEKAVYEKKLKYWGGFLKTTKSESSLRGENLSDSDIEQAREFPVDELITERIWSYGSRRKTFCPFHQEKTPSFVIYPDNSWHCFGCQAHGRNAIDFLMKRGGLSFIEAVRQLQ